MMNAGKIYEKCKSREPITSFNRAVLCVSQREIKKHRNNLAKLAILNSKSNGVPIPSHFVQKEFTLGALDNFDHSDKNSLSGLLSCHDTDMTLCQTKPRENATKSSKSEVNLESVESIFKLPCQEVTEFHSSNTIILSYSFEVSRDLYPSE